MRSALRARALRRSSPSTPTTLHPDLSGFPGSSRRTPIPSASYFHSKPRDYSEVLGAAAKLPEAEPVPPVVARQRATIADIQERRAKAGRLVAPTAAYSDADMFKAPVG